MQKMVVQLLRIQSLKNDKGDIQMCPNNVTIDVSKQNKWILAIVAILLLLGLAQCLVKQANTSNALIGIYADSRQEVSVVKIEVDTLRLKSTIYDKVLLNHRNKIQELLSTIAVLHKDEITLKLQTTETVY